MIISVLAFIALSAGAVFLCNILDIYFSTKAFAKPPDFFECINRIKAVDKCRQLFLLLEGLALICSVLLFSADKQNYKAKVVKITNKISIPASAGQGQNGSARFMNKQERKKAFGEIQVDVNNSFFSKILASSRAEYEEIEKWRKGVKEKEPKNKTERQLQREWRRNEKLIKKGIVLDGTDKRVPLKQRLKWKIEAVSLKFEKEKTDCKEKPSLKDRLSRFKWIANIQQRREDERCFKAARHKEQDDKPKVRHNVAPKERNLTSAAGIVVGMKKNGKNSETVYCINDDIHTLIIGATRCGKSRCLAIPSICTLALAGESIVATDPKGELSSYTRSYLEALGYEVIVLDFQTPQVSSRYNPLQLIINAVNDYDYSAAQSKTWDIVSFLVEKSEKGEPIWTNGEMSVMAAAILCVVVDNKHRPEFQNLTNVYWFISEMCKDVKLPNGTTYKPISKYIKGLPDEHPAKALLGIADVAPSRTAGSFYTSALSTLRLYITNEIYGMTCKSDFTLSQFADKKTALFFVLPDQNTTYYPIVTLLVAQMYESLVDKAKSNGNRLDRRVNFILDEFGNFTKITDFETKLTVGGGYGLRFNLFLQDFNQLKAKYGQDVANIIKGNCAVWIYLSSSDNETRQEWEKRLGEYTTTSYSLGSSSQKRSNTSSSSNVNLVGRALLKADEIALFERPYILVSQSGLHPVVMNTPDLSKWNYNRLLALGSKEHNKAAIKRKNDLNLLNHQHDTVKTALWGVWSKFNIM